MTPEQAPKFIPPNEVYVEFTDPYCVGIGDAHYCWDDKELVKDHPTTRYIRADRVELMVKLAVLEERVKYVQGTLGTERDVQSWISEIITIKEQLQ